MAWAERGSVLRNVFTSVGVQGAIRRAFGEAELGKVLRQLEATFNGGVGARRTPGELAAADRAMNFVTYAYLGFNPLSALKQTTSFTVWVNALPNGFRDLWRHMTHYDGEVVRHLKESEEYRVRYGGGVGSGQDPATSGLYENPSLNPVARLFSGAGMWLLKKGDFVPGVWIAQGVYKDLLDRHMSGGMEYVEADRRAVTETFNLLEETQQSGRAYNTNALTLEHGRIGRLLTQFATSPLQQLQYETQAWREWRDMVRYGMGEERIAEARGRLLRSVVINHVLVPAALELVVSAYRLVMGEEPPWRREGAHWDFLVEVLMGQFGRVFLLGAFAQTTLNAVLKRESPRGGQLLPLEGFLDLGARIGFVARDFATCDVDNLRRDLARAIRGSAATRTAYGVYRRVSGMRTWTADRWSLLCGSAAVIRPIPCVHLGSGVHLDPGVSREGRMGLAWEGPCRSGRGVLLFRHLSAFMRRDVRPIRVPVARLCTTLIFFAILMTNTHIYVNLHQPT